MATAILAKPHRKAFITEEEFRNLPDNGRKYELVEGALEEVPTNFAHDAIIFNLALLLGPSGKGRGSFTVGQAGFRMTRPRTVRCPDFSFTRKERIPGGIPGSAFGDHAPDLCVEVISPSERGPAMDQKIVDYFASGATLVWQMFPETRRLVVFTGPTDQRTLEADDFVDAGDLLPGFRARVGDLFALE